MSDIWFTSDLHLGHTNVIRYSKRPFSNITEMNETIIAQWNAVVQPGDRVYVLGDFAFTRPPEAVNFARRLNGQKYLIFGNHDRRLRENKPFMDQWVWGKDMAEIEVDGQKVVLCHYAMLVWNKSHYGSFMLHGHSHGSLPDNPNARRIDVGVDCFNYTPVNYDKIKELMALKEFKAIDHHGRKDGEDE